VCQGEVPLVQRTRFFFKLLQIFSFKKKKKKEAMRRLKVMRAVTRNIFIFLPGLTCDFYKIYIEILQILLITGVDRNLTPVYAITIS